MSGEVASLPNNAAKAANRPERMECFIYLFYYYIIWKWFIIIIIIILDYDDDNDDTSKYRNQ